MAGTPIIIVEYDALRIRLRRSHLEKLQIRLPELPTRVAEITMVVPRDAHGAALIGDHDAERQRPVSERRRPRLRADCIVKESTPA